MNDRATHSISSHLSSHPPVSHLLQVSNQT
jgi:hypothetical protein